MNEINFIHKAKEIHGSDYDYSKVNYINFHTKVCIICHKKDKNGVEHGEFWQLPSNHIYKHRGCPKCNGGVRLTTEDFIKKAKEIHGNKYNYSKVNYKNAQTKVCIICPEHGEFWQTPSSHLNGSGCQKCYDEKRGKSLFYTTNDFIKKAKQIHGNKYDYSKVEYERSNKKVCIICPEHGEFWQTPNKHLQGQGCPKCGKITIGIKKNITTQVFIERAKKIHGDKYDYSKVNYVNAKAKICIICPEHGEFWQKPANHLQGQGCPKCGGHMRLTTEEFIEKAKKVHGDKYDYSKVEYVNASTKVCIICPIHGEFWQKPINYLKGYGCKKCKESLVEKEVDALLKKENINFEAQKKFKWLGRQSLDFYLPDYKTAIECQGRQHFMPISKFGGEKEFEQIKKWDKKKSKLCNDNGIKILYFANYKFNFPYEVIVEEKDLIKKIKND